MAATWLRGRALEGERGTGGERDLTGKLADCFRLNSQFLSRQSSGHLEPKNVRILGVQEIRLKRVIFGLLPLREQV